VDAAEIARKQKEFLFPNVSTYYQDPLIIESGSGMFVKDVGGKQYLDFFGGILTVSVGHCHPTVTEAVIEQQRKLVHVSTLYPTTPQIELAEKLYQLKPMKEPVKSFFTNSGTEANETAVTLAKVATGRSDLVALRHSYGGRGLLAQNMMGNKNYRTLQSEVPGIKHAHAPYCYRCDLGLKYPDCGIACAKDIKTLIETTTTGAIAGFIAEPILGVGGVIVPPKEYFEVAVPIIRNAGGLFIADEVQTAWGRTGKWWGVQQFNVEPDILTSAKGMANGQPIGLTMAKADIANKFTGASISTFGGGPPSMAASLATLKVIEEEKLLHNAQLLGQALRDGLNGLAEKHRGIGDVRGMGLMQAIELVKDRGTREPDAASAVRLMEATRKRGLLVGKGGLYGNTMRIAPPMIVSRGQIDDALRIMGEALTEALPR
jgi:alanine-glyoxylate transaminase/(R)-3-amino-2-methylpropionate-pyruvate transaminase